MQAVTPTIYGLTASFTAPYIATLAGTLTADRTYTFPDAAITVAGTDYDNNWTATQDFAAITASGQITSTVTTGTAPLVIASTTVVANLNASLLLGQTWANPGAIGGTTPAAGAFTTLSTSGIATIVGSAPPTTVSGQVLIGGGTIRAAGNITGASLTSGASVYVSNTNGISLSDNAVGGSIGYGYNSGRTNPASHIWYNGISTQTMSLSAAGVLTTLAGISCTALTADDAGAGPQLTARGSVQGSVNILKTGAYGFQIYSNAVNSLQFYDNQAAYAPFSIYGGTPGTPGSTNVFVGNGQIKAGAGISCTTLTASVGATVTGAGTLVTKDAYSSAYPMLTLTTVKGLALMVDPSTIPGGSFSANNTEIMVPRGLKLISPNVGGTDWETAGLTTGAISCTTVTASGAINQTGGQYHYLRGDASTDGSVRFSSQSAGTMLIEKRDAGSWVSIGSFA